MTAKALSITLSLCATLVACDGIGKNSGSIELEKTPEDAPLTETTTPPIQPEAFVSLTSVRAPESIVVQATEDALVINGGEELSGAGGDTGGAYIVLSDEFEKAVSGKSVLVSVVAMSEVQTSVRLGMAYSTNDVGNSGWVWHSVSSTPNTYEMSYNVPELQSGKGDYVGFLAPDGAIKISDVQITIAD